ncbi:MAG: DUF805 domain-containing protein [Novosphingobium sp.]|nr:DUF805 domain-containing protein [Novosphingobium sp.]
MLTGIILAGGFSLAALSDPNAIPAAPGPIFYIGAGLIVLYWLAVIVPTIAVTIRRLHDRDMSGWFLLLFIVLSAIPLVGILASIAWLVLMVLPGTPGPNKYGPDPKDPTSSEVFV